MNLMLEFAHEQNRNGVRHKYFELNHHYLKKHLKI